MLEIDREPTRRFASSGSSQDRLDGAKSEARWQNGTVTPRVLAGVWDPNRKGLYFLWELGNLASTEELQDDLEEPQPRL